MDADGAADEQHVRWTAKSCGSDAPTLASSRRKYFRWRRWQTSPVTGKSAKETVKTIARGMPGCSGVTVVTMLVCFFILHARLRAHRAPGIPCALISIEGRTIWHNSGAFVPRERGSVGVIFARDILQTATVRASSSLPRLRGEGGAS